MNAKKLLILDLDETLVYSSTERLERAEDFTSFDYYVYKRPYVDEFLEFCFSHFDVAVWTSSSSAYAGIIVGKLLADSSQLKFLWCRERCTQRYDTELHSHYWIKDLKKVKKLGYNLDSVLFVDDSAEKLERNYGNHLLLTPFLGSPIDDELLLLKKYLLLISAVPNVRLVEKRGWRNKVKEQRL